MTELERIQTAKAAIAQVPGGEIWLEEFLIRGKTDGTISGGHAIYAYRAADAFGGKTPGQLMAPFPVSIVEGENAFQHVAEEINLAAIDTIAALNAQIADLQQQIEALQAEIASQQNGGE